MRFFLILGSNPAVSAAEIVSVGEEGGFTVVEACERAMLVQADEDMDVDRLMDRLGGTIKVGRIIEDDLGVSDDAMIEGALAEATKRRGDAGKVTFGLSAYTFGISRPAGRASAIAGRFKKVGMEVKRRLKEERVPCRFVRPPAGPALSSVVVEKNGLTGPNGFEFVVFLKGERMMTGVTVAVQPFERFSEADYGRPARNARQGMLPPKLARIMLNIAGVGPGQRVYDPFCGSGTVLTEALHLGVRKVVGSDINGRAVESTKENINWSADKGFVVAPDDMKLFQADARKVAEQIERSSIDAIVTEPFLGDPQTGNERRGELQKRLSELTRLYVDALRTWKSLLKPDAPVVMALPLYVLGNERHGINARELERAGFTAASLLPQRVLSQMGVRETKNKGLAYGRSDQHVWREIVRLRAAG